MKVIQALALLSMVAILATLSLSCGPRGACPEGQEMCEGKCYELSLSANHCGACGVSCAAGESCSRGMCVVSCPAGTTACDGGCVDAQNNSEHCGACGITCGEDEVCMAGACASGCSSGLEPCQGSCVDAQNNPEHCGACGVTCGDGEVCMAGSCVASSACAPSQQSCDGACRDTLTDENHCGACGVVCKDGERCQAGSCELSCQQGQQVCDDRCVDTLENRAHCGGCSSSCEDGELCQAGSCVAFCEQGKLACDGACVDTSTHPNHCGVCGMACGQGNECLDGACVEACPGGDARCGGVCVDTLFDDDHCGACGRSCSGGESCIQGSCVPCTDCPDLVVGFRGVKQMAVDADGNIYIAGDFSNTIRLGLETFTSRGAFDTFVTKLSPAGEVLWTRTIGGPYSVRPGSMAVDGSGNVFMTGMASCPETRVGPITIACEGSSGSFIAKFTTNGAVSWAKTIEINSAHTVLRSNDREVLVIGAFRDKLGSLQSNGGVDIALVVFDSTTGNASTYKSFGSLGDERVDAVAIDVQGNTYIAGTFSGEVTWSPNRSTTSLGGQDIFILVIDNSNGVVRVSSAGSISNDFVKALTTDASGGAVIAGVFTDKVAFGSHAVTPQGVRPDYIARLDAQGKWDWAHQFGESREPIRALTTNQSNRILVGGTYGHGASSSGGRISYGTFHLDYSSLSSTGFILELDLMGNYIGGTSIVEAGDTTNGGISIDLLARNKAGDTYAAGVGPSGFIGFGAKTHVSSGSFIARYKARTEPLCPTDGNEICGGVCTTTLDDPQNCGACAKSCSMNQTCLQSTCLLPPDGLMFKEVHVGGEDYIVVQNTSPREQNLLGVFATFYRTNIDDPSVDVALPDHKLAPGKEVYIVTSSTPLRQDEISLGASSNYTVNTNDFHMLLCFGPCESDGSNIFDALVVGEHYGGLPGNVSFEPKNVEKESAHEASYFRSGTQGAYPMFQQSDWQMGPKTRP